MRITLRFVLRFKWKSKRARRLLRLALRILP